MGRTGSPVATGASSKPPTAVRRGQTFSHPSEHTGCWQLHMDPRDPDVLYTVAHQRQRYLTTIVTGGDESGIYKTTDGGTTWNRLEGGLPQEMVGRIGMDISPVDPDVLFAVVDAAKKEEEGRLPERRRAAPAGPR